MPIVYLPRYVKQFTDGTALKAGSADFVGQVLTTLDGISFAIARNTLAGGTHADAVCLNDSLITNRLVPARIDMNGPLGSNVNWITTPAGSYVDNVLYLQNNSGGFTTVGFAEPNVQLPGRMVIGTNAAASATSDFAGNLLIVTNPDPANANTATAPGIALGYEGNLSSGGYLYHRAMLIDPVANSITAYGISTTTKIGPVGWYVGSDGRMGVGTSTLQSGCQMTVAGLAYVKSSGAGIIVENTAGGAPFIAGVDSFKVIADSFNQISIRNGTGNSNVYDTFGDTLASGLGHVFRTYDSGTSGLLTRFQIASDGVRSVLPFTIGSTGTPLKRVRRGRATLAAGTVTVSDANVTANTDIQLTAQDNSTMGALRVSARTAGTSFTILSSNTSDTGSVAYLMIEP